MLLSPRNAGRETPAPVATAEALMSQVSRPMRRAKVSGIAVPRKAMRRALTRTALAEASAPVAAGVNVRDAVFHVPNSMSCALTRVMGEPSQVLAAAMAMALLRAWVTLVLRPDIAARAA